MLLTQKNHGYVKVRAVFNGKLSHVWATKQETASPNEDNDSIMITAAIYDQEGRNVVVLDAPNAFIQTKIPHKEMGERVMIKLHVNQLI